MTTDLRATIAAADPARSDAYDDATLRDLARDVLDGPAASADREHVVIGPDAGQRRRVTTGRLAAALVIAAVLATGIVVTPSLVHRSSPDRRSALDLTDAVVDGIVAVDPPTRPGQYWRIETTGHSFTLESAARVQYASALVVARSTEFVPVDGASDTIYASAAPTLIRWLVGGPGDAVDIDAALASDGSVTTPPTLVTDVGGGTSELPKPAEFFASLPRDPTALAARFRDDLANEKRIPDSEIPATSRQSVDGRLFSVVGSILGSGLVPPDLRSALFRVLADVPGVVVSADDTDVAGVRGVGFTYTDPVSGLRGVLVIDPDTGVLTGRRSTTTREVDGIAAGTALSEYAFTRTLVDAVPADILVGTKVYHCTTAADRSVTCGE